MTEQEQSTVTDSSAPESNLSVDDKLDKIMEAVAFQTRLIASALIAFDKKLQQEQAPHSKIIKPLM